MSNANFLRIEFVKVNGRIVPKRFQDRWNLEMLGITCGGFNYDRNGTMLKRLRRAFEKEGFTFALVKGTQEGITDAERNLLKPANRKVA